MRKGAPIAVGLSLLVGQGCIWETVAETASVGNADSAVIIQNASPDDHQISAVVNPFSPICTLRVALPQVFSPHQEPLTARFFLNFDDPEAIVQPSQPLSIGGQTDFPLSVQPSDPNSDFLSTQTIPLDDFLAQLSNPSNILWVFVSDDFADCPDPSTAPSGTQSQTCFTTSWFWLIDLTQCPLTAQ
jgi:hypothetical protein